MFFERMWGRGLYSECYVFFVFFFPLLIGVKASEYLLIKGTYSIAGLKINRIMILILFHSV